MAQTINSWQAPSSSAIVGRNIPADLRACHIFHSKRDSQEKDKIIETLEQKLHNTQGELRQVTKQLSRASDQLAFDRERLRCMEEAFIKDRESMNDLISIAANLSCGRQPKLPELLHQRNSVHKLNTQQVMTINFGHKRIYDLEQNLRKLSLEKEASEEDCDRRAERLEQRCRRIDSHNRELKLDNDVLRVKLGEKSAKGKGSSIRRVAFTDPESRLSDGV